MSRAKIAIVVLACSLIVGLGACGSESPTTSEGDKVTLQDGRKGVRTASGNIRLDSGEVVDDSGALVPDENPATVEQLCTAMVSEECSQAWEYEQCMTWFNNSRNSTECAGEVHLLLKCVDMDVSFECDYNGVPYPKGIVEDADAAVLNEYCEEEWFNALDCVGAENSATSG